jgi:AmmeMemoRadiSam system protein A
LASGRRSHDFEAEPELRHRRDDPHDRTASPRRARSLFIDLAERRRLLALARASLVHSVGQGRALAPSLDDLPEESILRAKRGVFVSLHHHSGALRGCVGSVSASAPLVQVVAEMTHAAASRDLRFPPVSAGEIDELTIEVSVLSALEPLGDLSEVEIGKDGLLVSGLGHRGVLLPQVASEHGWDAETFAGHTCMKAGLPPDGFRQKGVEMFRFNAEVISEEDELQLAL